MKMRKQYWVVIVVFVLVGGWYWYSTSQSDMSTTRYITQPVEKGVLKTSITGTGNVVIDQSATVDPTISGTVENLAVKVGDQVKKGQVLFTIDNDQLGVSAAKAGVSFRSAEQSILSAQASRKSARADLDQAERGSNKSSRQERDVLEKKLDAAKVGEDVATRNLEVARLDYLNQMSIAAKRIVKSSIDGTIQEVNIKNGDDLSRISSGSSAVAPIIVGDLSTLKAVIQVNEVDISGVSVGQEVNMRLDALEGMKFSGKVEKIDALGTVSQGVVTYNVTIGFDELDSRIKPQMSVSAVIITGSKEDVIMAPNSAVKSEGEESYVEVLVGGAPIKKPIQTGLSNATNIEIISGASPGDQVITQTIMGSDSSTSTQASGFRLPGIGGGASSRNFR